MFPTTLGQLLILSAGFCLLVFLITSVFKPLPRSLWLLLTIVSVCFLIAFLIADIAATAYGTQPKLANYVTYPTLHLLGIDPYRISIDIYKPVVSTVLRTLLALNTLWFAVVLPLARVRQLEAQLARREVVQIRPIAERGVDDVRTLIDLLKRAHQAVMFAGGFGWLVKAESANAKAAEATSELKTIIERMIDDQKITFVSNTRNTDHVRRLLESIDGSFAKKFMPCFKDHSHKKQKVFFTLLWYDGLEMAFCSRVGRIPDRSSTDENNIVVSSRVPGGDTIIGIVKNLIDPDALSNSKGAAT